MLGPGPLAMDKANGRAGGALAGVACRLLFILLKTETISIN
jgi:hypothetical protein